MLRHPITGYLSISDGLSSGNPRASSRVSSRTGLISTRGRLRDMNDISQLASAMLVLVVRRGLVGGWTVVY